MNIALCIKRSKDTWKKALFNSIPYITFFLIMLVMHNSVFANFRDDAVNIGVLEREGSIFSILKSVRQGQSSRSIVEFFLLLMLKLPIYVFRIIDSLAYVLCAWSIGHLFRRSSSSAWLSVALVMLFPMSQMCACGWVTTSVVYLWTLAALMYSFTWMSLYLSNNKIPVYYYITIIIATLFASNHEQGAALTVGFVGVFLLYCIANKKKISILAYIQLAIACIMLIMSITSEGNANRSYAELVGHMPDFYHKSLFARSLELFIDTSRKYLFGANIALLALGAALCYIVWEKHKNTLYTAIAVFPLIVMLALGPAKQITFSLWPGIKFGMENANVNVFSVSSYVIPFISVVTWGMLLLTIYLAFFDDRDRWLLGVLLILGGLASRMILVVSPSYLASGYRTSIFLYFAVIILLYIAMQQILTKNKEGTVNMIATVAITALALFNTLSVSFSL